MAGRASPPPRVNLSSAAPELSRAVVVVGRGMGLLPWGRGQKKRGAAQNCVALPPPPLSPRLPLGAP